ncbi:Amicyanin-alpha precursor [compost metagenome]
MGVSRLLSLLGLLQVAMLLAVPPLAAQPLTAKTVNIESPDPTPLGQLDFPFTHRFSIFGSKVTSSPTFTLSTGLSARTSAALRYATNSDVNLMQPGAFNEWEPLIKVMGLSQVRGAPLDLTGIAAYNTAAGSADAALVLARRWGSVSLLGTLKGFSNGYGMGAATAVGAGLRWDLTRFLQVSADLNGVTSGGAAASGLPAWSVGTTFEIPYSPHTVSLYVTNASTHTLQGTSRGTSQLRGGFEFLVPFTSWRRWAAIFAPPPEPAAVQGSVTATASPPVTMAVAASEANVTIQGMKYVPETVTVAPGGIVSWVNRDSMDHTVTSTTGLWDSGTIRPGETWSRRFDAPGSYPYVCTPHPFMTGTVVVR